MRSRCPISAAPA